MELIIHLLLLGLVIFILAEILPGVHVEGYGTAVLVAVVYGLINVTLGTILKIVGIPFIIVTLGFFLLLINTFLLWLTDQLMDSFEIKNIGTTFLVALIITITDSLITALL